MIIGVTGTHGAGKGTVVEYLVTTRGFAHVAVSDTFLRGEALHRGLTPDRPTRRDIANEYRALGPTALMEKVYELALPYIESGKDVVIEPQHTVAEVQFIQSKGGIVLAVDAPLAVRFERITGRGSEKDSVEFDEFVRQQEHEMSSDDPNRNNLGAAMFAADYVVANNGTLDELHVRIDAVLAQIEAAV